MSKESTYSYFKNHEIISAYSRKQAIDDGVLVDLMQGKMEDVCRQHFKYPIAVTSSVYSIIEKAVNNPKWCNDFAGVLHDMLHMSKCYFQKIDESSRYFKVIITGAGRKRNFVFKLIVHPGDNMEPVITIMLPNED